MTPLTAEKIAELERLLGAATAGPWHVETGSGQLGTIEAADGTMVAQSQAVIGDRHHERREANTALIAAAVNALPALLSLAKRVAGAPVVRFNDDGSLDEVVGFGEFHLEQMSGTHWWMQLGPRMVNLTGTFVCAKATSR